MSEGDPLLASGRRLIRGAFAIAMVLAAVATAAAGPYTIPDAELAANFAVEWGTGTLAKTDVAGPGVEFLMTVPDKTAVGDNYPVGDQAALLWDPVLHHFTSLAAYDSIAVVIRYVSGPAGSDVDVHLFLNTGLTGPSGNPSDEPANDTFWGGTWVTLAVGETRTVVLDFSAAEAYNAADNPEPHSGAGQAWVDGDVHAINDRDRHEVSHLGIEVSDFDGDTGGQAVALLLNVPEPATAALLSAGLASLLLRRRRVR